MEYFTLQGMKNSESDAETDRLEGLEEALSKWTTYGFLVGTYRLHRLLELASEYYEGTPEWVEKFLSLEAREGHSSREIAKWIDGDARMFYPLRLERNVDLYEMAFTTRLLARRGAWKIFPTDTDDALT